MKTKRQSNSRPARWQRAIDKLSVAREALEELEELRQEYEDWRDSLPENLQSSALADKLNTVADMDIQSVIEGLDEIESADLPLGFGRDY